MKKLMLLAVVGTVAPALFASIVHTPREAWSKKENPGTDSQGAVWTASRRTYANNPISSGILLDQPLYGDTVCGFQRWDSGDSQVYLYFGETPDGHVNPGDIVMKPTAKGYGNVRVAVTFEAPRSGWYSMSARFRAINTTQNGDLDTSIILGGSVLQQQTLTHTQDGAPGEGTLCSFTRKFLPKGTKLEFVVGPRWDDWNGYWDAHWGDTTTLSLSLVEEESIGDESAVKVADLGAMLVGLTPETAGTTGSFEDQTGLGVWSLYRFARGSSPSDDNARVALSRVAATDVGSAGVAFRSPDNEDADPHVKVNGSTTGNGLLSCAARSSSRTQQPAPGVRLRLGG